MTDKPFDLSSFMKSAGNPSEDVRRDMMIEAVNDDLDNVMSEVAPRLWAVMQSQMMLKPDDPIHLNAVLNASIFALMGWLAVCTPGNDIAGSDSDEALREKVLKNLDAAVRNTRDQGAQISSIAQSVGSLKLMEDSLSGMAKTVTANSIVLQAAVDRLKGGA